LQQRYPEEVKRCSQISCTSFWAITWMIASAGLARLGGPIAHLGAFWARRTMATLA
jgi:hypothetical protein